MCLFLKSVWVEQTTHNLSSPVWKQRAIQKQNSFDVEAQLTL